MTTVSASGLIGNAYINIANTPTPLGTLGAAMTVQILVCNQNVSGNAAKVQIAISQSNIAPNPQDWIDMGGPSGVPPLGSRDRGGIPCASGDTIYIQSDTVGISARAGGVLLP